MVYCTNCTYWSKWYPDSKEKFCTCPENIVENITPLRNTEVLRDKYFHDSSNEMNNCMWYKRKLFKFWVKEKGNDLPPDLLPFWLWAKESHPELIFEWMLTVDEKAISHTPSPSSTVSVSPSASPSAAATSSRPKPTPHPTAGARRLIGLI